MAKLNTRAVRGKKTAEQSYAAHVKEIAGQIAQIQMKLARHATRAAKKPGDWGFVGDLDNVSETLSEIDAWLSTEEDA